MLECFYDTAVVPVAGHRCFPVHSASHIEAVEVDAFWVKKDPIFFQETLERQRKKVRPFFFFFVSSSPKNPERNTEIDRKKRKKDRLKM